MTLLRAALIAVAAGAMFTTAAEATDLLLPADPGVIYDDVAFSFEGAYIGLLAGAEVPTDRFGGLHHTAGVLGAAVGANFLVSDAIMAGAELQAIVTYGGSAAVPSGFTSADILALGRIGALVTDEVMIYAAAGVGIVGGPGFSGVANDTVGYYAIGAGAEVGVTDNLGLRGEVLYKHLFSSQAQSGSAVEATAGLIWHIN